MSQCAASSRCAASTVAPADVAGRRRDPNTLRPRMGRAAAAVLNGVARLGTVVTLCALIVLGGAVCGLIDATPDRGATTTVTFDGPGH